MENFAKQKREEPSLDYMVTELEILESGPGHNFTTRTRTSSQEYSSSELTKVAGLNLYSTQTANIGELSSHKVYTQKGADTNSQPAGTCYEQERQLHQSGDQPYNNSKDSSWSTRQQEPYRENRRSNSYTGERDRQSSFANYRNNDGNRRRRQSPVSQCKDRGRTPTRRSFSNDLRNLGSKIYDNNTDGYRPRRSSASTDGKSPGRELRGRSQRSSHKGVCER